jgi:SAM-dependent methyltransferase
LSTRARSFDVAAEAYERGRPGWPDAMLDPLPLPGDATVLDLGAGTGKLTRTLVRRYARVLPVEPLPGMRAILERELPDVEALAGEAAAIPLDDASVDGVFCGQSAHWFADDDSIAEIARVLRPGGVFARLWNDTVEPSPLPEPYRRRMSDLHDEMRPARIREDILDGTPFGEAREAAVEHEQVSTREDVLAFAASVSWIANRDDREEVLAELAAMLPEREYRFPMRANVAWAHRV